MCRKSRWGQQMVTLQAAELSSSSCCHGYRAWPLPCETHHKRGGVLSSAATMATHTHAHTPFDEFPQEQLFPCCCLENVHVHLMSIVFSFFFVALHPFWPSFILHIGVLVRGQSSLSGLPLITWTWTQGAGQWACWSDPWVRVPLLYMASHRCDIWLSCDQRQWKR